MCIRDSDWMIETNGWALEPVAADGELDPPRPSYAYTIGLPDAVGFPDVAILGLTPVAANGLATLIADACRGGTEIPLNVEVIGLLDNDLRCLFAPIDAAALASWFTTSIAWHRGAAPSMVQLLYPDRNGFLPYEAGFDQRMRFAQPVLNQLSPDVS